MRKKRRWEGEQYRTGQGTIIYDTITIWSSNNCTWKQYSMYLVRLIKARWSQPLSNCETTLRLEFQKTNAILKLDTKMK